MIKLLSIYINSLKLINRNLKRYKYLIKVTIIILVDYFASLRSPLRYFKTKGRMSLRSRWSVFFSLKNTEARQSGDDAEPWRGRYTLSPVEALSAVVCNVIGLHCPEPATMTCKTLSLLYLKDTKNNRAKSVFLSGEITTYHVILNIGKVEEYIFSRFLMGTTSAFIALRISQDKNEESDYVTLLEKICHHNKRKISMFSMFKARLCMLIMRIIRKTR